MLNQRNFFQIDGNLVRDPQRRYTGGGTLVACYTVATKNYRGNTVFIPVQTLGRQAENDLKYLKAKSGVVVAGEIGSWFDQAKGKGGFNFDAQSVIYKGGPRSASADDEEEDDQPAPTPEAGHDQWLQDFDAHQQPAGR